MSKTDKKTVKYRKINGTDVFIFALLVITLIAVLFKGAILEQMQSMAVRDTATVKIRCEQLDSGVEKMILKDCEFYEDDNYFGKLIGEKNVSGSNIYTIHEKEIIAVSIEGKVDMTCEISVSGAKTDSGFILPGGRIIRVNDTVSLNGQGFTFEAIITDIYAE